MAKPLQKERENRSAEKKDIVFHPFSITPETAHTSVLLLESKEPEVLCQTLRAVTKFAGQDMSNRQLLFDLGAIKHILPHVDHAETNIKRFALKALGQMCQLPRGPEQVLYDTAHLRRVAVLLTKVEDIFVLEFSSLVLAELTKEPDGCEQLVHANILTSLFNRMKNSLDPDVQKNCLQVLHNVLSDPVCGSEVTKNPQFNWPALLALMQSPYLAIQQLALRTVDGLVMRYNDPVIQRSFKASTGVLDLCDILESYEFRDVHTLVLGVLRTYVETEENAAHLYQAGCILRLLGYLDMALPAMKPHCIAVLTKMSSTFNGRIALYESGTDLVFCHQLLGTNNDLLADAALGVANMCKMIQSAVRMTDTNIIEALVGILGDESAAWFDVRMNSLLSLSVLCLIIPKAAFAIVEHKTFSLIRNINRKPKDSPIEAQRLAVQLFINLLNYEQNTKAMLTPDFINELLQILGRPDVALKIMVCSVLTTLCVEPIGKEHFSAKGGEQVLSENLTIEHVGLRTALCQLIVASVTDDGADVYLDLGTIYYMIENKNARYVVPAWEPAIEVLFHHHPSAKLAYTGRLEINDFTTEGFYVVKRLGDTFPTMEEILSSMPPHEQPVLVTMFHPPPFERASSMDIRSPYPTSHSRLNISPSMNRVRLPPLPDDVNLRAYLLRLRIWFGDPAKSLHYFEIEDAHYEVRYREKCTEVSSSLKTRAMLLGEFVAEQMSGLTQERDCTLPSVELHLADLMLEIQSRVVGIGWVKCGGALERAILYKVLADRIGLPCSLHRATNAYAWVEVAVPEIDPEMDPDEEEKYPAGLLRANYVVDLMEHPGHLIPRTSPNAIRICGPACEPLYVARCPPVICKCDNTCRRDTRDIDSMEQTFANR